MTIALTGASGFVGRHLVATLLERGHRVRALARDRGKAARTLPIHRIELILGDVFDAQAMRDLTDGADALIHLIGIRREAPGGVTFQRLHVDATASALSAASEAGVRRYLHMSALGVRPDAVADYHRSKYEAECLVRDSSLAWTIFRPSVILGADGEFMEMARGWVRGQAMPKRFLPYFRKPPRRVQGQIIHDETDSASLQPIDVEDVASAFASALERDEAIGEVYPLGGPDVMTWPQLLESIRDATPGAKPGIKPKGVPVNLARAAATFFGWLGLGQLLPFGPDEPIMASEENTCSQAKAQAHLAMSLTPFSTTLARSVTEA